MSPDIDPPPKYKAWIQDHEVWIETSMGDRRVTYDALAAEPAAVSPNGDRVVYALINPIFDAEHCGNTPQKYVVMVSAWGERIWKGGPEDACNDYTKFEWIDYRRVGVMQCGNANCFYWVLDASTGATQMKMATGFTYLWSHNRRWVAHRSVGNFVLDPDTMAVDTTLWFNDDSLPAYPPQTPRTGISYAREIIDDMTWSPDDAWLSFPEVEYPSYDSFVVLVSPEGKVLRDSLPVDVNDAVISWTDSTHFQITASGRTFKYHVQGDELQEIVDRASPVLH